MFQGEIVSDLLHPLDRSKSMGWMGSIQGYRKCWQKCSSSHFPSFITSPGLPVRSQMSGSWQMWCPSTRSIERRIQRRRGLSAWPFCQGRPWTRSPWVPVHGIWHVQDNQGIRPRHCGFVKGRPCLTNLVSFHGKMACLVDEEKSVLGVYLDFDTISHSALLEKLAAPSLHRSSCTALG